MALLLVNICKTNLNCIYVYVFCFCFPDFIIYYLLFYYFVCVKLTSEITLSYKIRLPRQLEQSIILLMVLTHFLRNPQVAI